MAITNISLLPQPQRIHLTSGNFVIEDEGLITLDAPRAADLLPAGAQVEKSLWKTAQLNWGLNASAAVLAEQQRILLRLSPERVSHAQGYRLHIRPNQILIEGHDGAGVFYGACTLVQIISQFGRQIPCLEIQDWPDFEARGVMLDISRDKVCRMETLYELIERLASWKINQIQLYTEHTFAYCNHPMVWKDSSPMTGEEILALDRFCREHFIEIVPNQNSFGHLTRWLEHPEYAPLAEIHGKFQAPWGPVHGPFSVAPEDPASLKFILGLYDELLPHFSSRMMNIGCDETFDLGAGRSKKACEERGTGRVYLDFLLKLYANLKQRGFTTQFWGDIILQHPELVDDLPRDSIALEWGYEGSHPFAEHGQKFAASGVPFYVCPGTSSWNTLVGKTDNALENLLNAAINGKKYGAIGYLVTDWGDNGHWQTLPVSFLGFGAAAAYSWACESNRKVKLAEAVSRFAFDDPSGAMGKLAYDLGNAAQKTGLKFENSTALFQMLFMSLPEISRQPHLAADNLIATLEAIDAAMSHLRKERITRPDADLIREEYQLGAQMARHACHRGLLALRDARAPLASDLRQDMQEILTKYRAIWLRRNRPGGLEESVRRLEEWMREYQV